MNLTFLVVSSSTTLFSFGTLPVFEPEEAARAPVSVMVVLKIVGSDADPRCS